MSAREKKLSEAIDYLLAFAERAEQGRAYRIDTARWQTFRRLLFDADAEPTTPPPPAPETTHEPGCPARPFWSPAHGKIPSGLECLCHVLRAVRDAAPPAQEAGAPTRRCPCGLVLNGDERECGYDPRRDGPPPPPLKTAHAAPEKTKPPAEDAETWTHFCEAPPLTFGLSGQVHTKDSKCAFCGEPRPSKSPGGGR